MGTVEGGVLQKVRAGLRAKHEAREVWKAKHCLTRVKKDSVFSQGLVLSLPLRVFDWRGGLLA